MSVDYSQPISLHQLLCASRMAHWPRSGRQQYIEIKLYDMLVHSSHTCLTPDSIAIVHLQHYGILQSNVLICTSCAYDNIVINCANEFTCHARSKQAAHLQVIEEFMNPNSLSNNLAGVFIGIGKVSNNSTGCLALNP